MKSTLTAAQVRGGFVTSSGYPDTALKLWTVDGALSKTFAASRGEVRSIATWGDEFFATGALNQTARVLRLDSDAAAAVLDHPAPVLAVACARPRDAAVLVTAAGDKTLRCFRRRDDDAATWDVARTVRGAEAISLCAVGDVVLAGPAYPETRLSVWATDDLATVDGPTPKPRYKANAHSSDATTLAAAPAEDAFVSCSCDDTMLVWKRDDATRAWTPDGARLPLPAAPPTRARQPTSSADDATDFQDMLAARASHVPLAVLDGARVLVAAGSAASPRTLVVRDLASRTRTHTFTFDAALLAAAAADGVLCVGDAEGGVHFLRGLQSSATTPAS